MTYGIKYTIKMNTNNGKGYGIQDTKNLTQEEGLADGLLLVSIVKSDEGDFSISVFGGYSETDPIPPLDIFKCWAMLADALTRMSELMPWQKTIAQEAFEKVRSIILEARGIY